MKVNIITLLLTGLFLISGVWAAQPGKALSEMGHGMNMLDLSEDQRNQIAELKLNLQKEIMPLHSEMQKLRSDLKIELVSDRFDEAKVKKIITDLADLEKDVHLKKILNQRAIRDILSPDQQKKFDLFVLSREGRGKRDIPGFEHRGPRMPADNQRQE